MSTTASWGRPRHQSHTPTVTLARYDDHTGIYRASVEVNPDYRGNMLTPEMFELDVSDDLERELFNRVVQVQEMDDEDGEAVRQLIADLNTERWRRARGKVAA